MYLQLQQRLLQAVAAYLRAQGVEAPPLVVEQPPRVELGEYALPTFQLAKLLRKAPKKIAEEIVAGSGAIAGFAALEVAGSGYINARLDRGALARGLMRAQDADAAAAAPRKVLVEHTSINPNKAAHIGHLRNAILGDSFVRLLRAAGHHVAVQNYIDNTGVQVADVVTGFIYLEGKSAREVGAMIERDSKPNERSPAALSARFDYVCWDLYARVSQWYEESKQNAARRGEVLHAIEAGGNEIAQLAELISTTIVRYHVRTMERLGIEYDFLPRESEILHLNFWDAAYRQLKEKGIIYLEQQGTKAGCWVMKRPGAVEIASEDDTKVIVRSNGTVVYEGKDIAYHLWKFGLLGKDFGYQRLYRYPDGRECWVSAELGEPEHPHFGGVDEIYNVIDSRQIEAQNTVMDALRGLGYGEQAERYHHFSYEMVALTPRCATELGYQLSEEEAQRAFIEVSGRRGFGVKADDFFDQLIAAAQKEVDTRHAELADAERRAIAAQIAVGALRYFMLKFTKNSVIAFDLREALSFEGETGPYAQYAAVRAANIFRKAGVTEAAALAADADFSPYFAGENGDELWELWLAAAKTGLVIEQCIATTEPAYATKHAFQLAQAFNNFYHRHHILNEPDAGRKRFLLATAAVVRRELVRTLAVMGIEAPPVM